MKRECTPMMMSPRGWSWLVLLSRLGELLLAVALGVVSGQAQPYAYVTNVGLSRVSVIDTATDMVVGDPIPVGAGPRGVAITPDGSTAYVASEFAGTVTWIDTATRITGFLSVGPAKGVAISGGLAYVTHLNPMDGSGAVAVIDTMSVPPSLVTRVSTGAGPSGVAISLDGATAIVTNSDSISVSFIDTATYGVVTLTDPSYNEPAGVAITPDGAYAFITNNNSNVVSVVETTGYTVVATAEVGLSPLGVVITPDGSRAYVTNQFSDSVTVIDTESYAVLATIPLGGEPPARPTGVAITPDGNRAYVANNGLNFVSVIDTDPNSSTYNTVVDTVPGVGFGAFGVAITPF